MKRPRQAKRVPDELLVVLREPRRKPERVAFQWRDGAGELQIAVLSPAQSWPYLN